MKIQYYGHAGVKIEDDLICHKIFKSNNFFGLLIFLILIFK